MSEQAGRSGHAGICRRHWGAPTRRSCAYLRRAGFLGIGLDGQRNTENALLVSVRDGRVKVRVIHTDEEIMIAQSVIRALALGSNREA